MPNPMEISGAYARLTLHSKLLPADELLEDTGGTAEFLLSADYVDWRALVTAYAGAGRRVYTPHHTYAYSALEEGGT